MSSPVYACKNFLLWNALDERQAMDAWPALTGPARELKRPAAFFSRITSGFLLAVDSGADIFCDPASLARLLTIALETKAGMVYSDFRQEDGKKFSAHPLNDYQEGSLRDDFNFGRFFIFPAPAIGAALAKYGLPSNDPDTILYDLRLKISADHPLIHVPEFLYTASVKKTRPARAAGNKTEAQFDYVSRINSARQKKLEKIATAHLKRIGAYLPPQEEETPRQPEELQWKASIVIPVLNRKKTIADALESALSQATDFAFNVIVVDNHSTDGTAGILKNFAARYPHVHHLIPQRRDLGIGGCWNEAMNSPLCGRYVVQLDSDDLYSSPDTLRKMVESLRKGYAMVVGSYTLVNEKLQPIAPGLIDHREWTRANGHNNLLRVNGMGAPRAFDAAVLRRIGFPDVSYGEDYAVALRLTREYKIGRIFESLYLCRRWKDNTDASLSVEKQNHNDYYKDKLRTIEIKARQQLCKERFETVPYKALPSFCRDFFEAQKKSWPELQSACASLTGVRTRRLACVHYDVALQFNPARAVSGGAAVDPESIRKRPCFLCAQNRPLQQQGIEYLDDYLILCNPAPIFDRHFTVAARKHRPQEIGSSMDAFLRIAGDAAPEYTALYNGPACGASAPDHLHFQLVPSATLPFLDRLRVLPALEMDTSVRISTGGNFDRTFVVLESADVQALQRQFLLLLAAARNILNIPKEPPVNVFCDSLEDNFRLVVFLRGKHRPDAYFAEGENRIFVSPGAIDMAGTIVTPRLADFERLDCEAVRGIYREVSLEQDTLMRIIEVWRSFNAAK